MRLACSVPHAWLRGVHSLFGGRRLALTLGAGSRVDLYLGGARAVERGGAVGVVGLRLGEVHEHRGKGGLALLVETLELLGIALLDERILFLGHNARRLGRGQLAADLGQLASDAGVAAQLGARLGLQLADGGALAVDLGIERLHGEQRLLAVVTRGVHGGHEAQVLVQRLQHLHRLAGGGALQAAETHRAAAKGFDGGCAGLVLGGLLELGQLDELQAQGGVRVAQVLQRLHHALGGGAGVAQQLFQLGEGQLAGQVVGVVLSHAWLAHAVHHALALLLEPSQRVARGLRGHCGVVGRVGAGRPGHLRAQRAGGVARVVHGLAQRRLGW
mmetsp:Transcript_14215/g.44434  ORF Transcript_14215/g.44434 Transcript_14215/m.44434 type:complete len:330 (+) Transcript_14215:56-1045(+)